VLGASALNLAARNGETDPTRLCYVEGTRGQGAKLMNTSIAQHDEPSYIIEMQGRFTSYPRNEPVTWDGVSFTPTNHKMFVVVSSIAEPLAL
jgi:hypothetical protein